MKKKVTFTLVLALLLFGCTPSSNLEPEAATDGAQTEAVSNTELGAEESGEGTAMAATAVVPVEEEGELEEDGRVPNLETRQAELDSANRSVSTEPDPDATKEGPEPGTETGTTGGSAVTQTGDVVIVAADASLTTERRFIEIQNNSSAPIQLNGWVLRDEAGTILFEFPEHVLQPQESCLLYPGEAPAGEEPDTQEECVFYFEPGASPVWAENSGCLLLSDLTRVVANFCLP